MPDIDLDSIVASVLTILTTDSRTKAVNWEKGRFSPNTLRTFPAGAVNLGPVNLGWASSPSGFGGTVTVRIPLWTAKHEGVTAAEEQIQKIISDCYAVLFSDTNIQLAVASYTTKPWIESLTAEDIISNVESSPVQAEATLLATYRIRK